VASEQRWESLCLAVRSVHRQSRPASEIILVIDNNISLLQRAKAAFPGVRVIPNSDLPGMAGARLCGLQAARGRLIAFVEGDVVASPDWLSDLVSVYNGPRRGGAAYPQGGFTAYQKIS
jgi:glycosyltransferase involved in cell wall biosynthesis